MRIIYKNGFIILLMLVEICIAEQGSFTKYYTKSRKRELREDVRRMFHHAYDGYLRFAANYDELRPLTCDGHDTWGSYSLTLIDALDTLATMGNYSEFQRVAALLETKMNFDKDINVSVFETNIRIVGGLLSAHLLSKRVGIQLESGWPCQGPLLRLAEDVAKRLLPAFDTATGMPYGTVNLRYGVPKGETSVTCTAGVGTFLIEFGTLSRLTGNTIYEEVALNAIYALWERRSPIGLFGNHIDVQTGRWTALDSGIGAGVDSFFEYLVKGAMLLNRPELLQLFHQARESIDKYLRKDDWYVWAGMSKGQVTLPVFQSLESFWPGILGIIGDHGPAIRTIKNYISVWNKYGFLPEFYNIASGEAAVNREVYPLRPELVESAMYLYRSTKNQLLLELGETVLETLEYSAKTRCGYATIRNVVTHEKENRMESFFLAETTKYLYLLFDEDNFLHNNGAHGEPHVMDEGGKCLVHAGAYIFNTEAHPMDMSALYCCHDINENIYSDLDFNVHRYNSLLKDERNHVEPCKIKASSSSSPKGEDREQTNNNEASVTVDIQVYDEDNNPAADMLIKNFERVKNEDEFMKSDNFDSISTRNQLTVNDLHEFFGQTRENFRDANEALGYVRKFMHNYTMDVAFIRGLNILDKNLTNILGASVQNEYESRMRTLWDLYELEQRYVANVQLINRLGLFNFQEGARLQLSEVMELLDGRLNDDTSEKTLLITNAIEDARQGYQNRLVNTTAMQMFMQRIYIRGTNESKIKFKPLLEERELETLVINTVSPASEERELFMYTRRIVEFKKHMTETVQRLQLLVQQRDAKQTNDVENGLVDDLIVATTDADAGNVNPNTSINMKTLSEETTNTKTDTEKEKEQEEEESNSVWSQLVQTILRQTRSMPRAKFDERVLHEKTRESLKKYTVEKTLQYDLFTCRRPSFIENFAYRDFYPSV